MHPQETTHGDSSTHRQEMHACPARRVFPTPLFFTEPYLQSSIPRSIHLTQRGEFGTHFFERLRGGGGGREFHSGNGC